ncbi:MAG: hypothetical protein R3D27_00470 [Hyphomicrobiaceae bacterium]
MIVILATALVAGCASEAGQGGPKSTGSVPGGRCQELKAEAARLEARGVQYKADQAGRGEIKLSPAQKAEVDRYNAILDRYLGGKCHL